MSSETSPDTPSSESCPYIGLLPFTEEISHYFFGRERDIEIIVSNLYVAKLTILYGASGVGKSSVLMAGVLPELKRMEQFVVVLFREWQRVDFESALSEAILTNEIVVEKMRESGQLVHLDAKLPFDELLAECAKALRLSFLFIFDQFEEYFLNEASSHSDSFDAQLARAINRRETHANFLVSIREDSLSGLDRFHGRVSNLLNNILRLENLDHGAAAEAILEPINVYNQRHPHPEPMMIEASLVKEVLDQVTIKRINVPDGTQEKIITELDTRASSEKIEAPYLQMVLTVLWNEEVSKGSRILRVHTLNKLGNADEIVRKQFDGAMDSLGELERDLAAQLLNNLVTPTGLKISHTATDLSILIGKPRDRVNEVLTRLSSQELRILRPVAPLPGQPGTERYEIFHDALAPAITAWESHYYIERERRRREYQLRKAKEEHEHQLRNAKEEQEKAEKEKRRWKNIVIAFVVLLFALIGFYGYAVYQKHVAEKAQREALKEKSNAVLALEEVKRLDSALPHSRFVLRGHSGAVNDIEFNSNGTYVVTASEDKTSRVWDAITGDSKAVLEGHSDVVISASFSPDSARVITASKDKTARVWDISTGKNLANLAEHVDVVNCAIFSPNGRLIFTGSGDNTARLWDANSYAPVAELRGHTGPVTHLAFSPDGNYLLTCSEDNTAIVWDARNGNRLRELRGHTGVIYYSVFSPDGRFVATASADNTARVWNASNGKYVMLRGHTGPVNRVAFSSDGKFVVTSSNDKTAQVWDALTGNTLVKLGGHTNGVINAAFLAGGKSIVTISLDRTARVWDTAKGEVLFALQGGHTDFILAGAYSPDSNLVATASGDRTARIWTISDKAASRGFRVTEAVLEANPRVYSGECPTTIEFKGHISVIGSGKVSYRFVRSNGASGQIQTLTFDTSGSKDVSTTWTLGSPNDPEYTGWQQIEILEPSESKSTWEKAVFKVLCEYNADLIVPKQISPKDREKLDRNPKQVPLQWEPVPNSASYRVEVDYYDPDKKRWLRFSRIISTTETSHTITFRAALRGRWRVWAVDSEDRTGKKSDWCEFEFKH